MNASKLLNLSLVLCLVFMLAGFPTAALAEPATGLQITGRITDGSVGVPGAIVSATHLYGGPDWSYSTTTDSMGYYTLDVDTPWDLTAPGDYAVTAYKIGMEFFPYNPTYFYIGSTVYISFYEGPTEVVNFDTTERFSIGGYVYDGLDPVPGAVIEYAPGKTVRTYDAEGEWYDGFFQISGLTAGTYTLSASKDGYDFYPQARVVTIPTPELIIPGGHFQYQYTLDFYTPNTDIWTGEGDNYIKVADLAGFSGFRIAGRVVDTVKYGVQSNPISGVTINAGNGHVTMTDDNGNYSLDGLAAGTYTITATKDNYIFETASVSVTVPPATIDNLFFVGLPVIHSTITNQQGGTLTSQWNDTITTITAPPGAIGQDVTLIYTPGISTDSSPSSEFTHQKFSLQAELNGEVLDHYSFNEPLTIAFDYSDADIAGVNEATLNLYYWEEGSQTWVPASTTCAPEGQVIRDLENNRLQVEICHFSEFTVYGWPPNIQPPEPPTVTVSPEAIEVNEGSSFTASGSFSDSSGSSWSATVDYGDGLGAEPLALNTDKTFAFSHTYIDSGFYTIKVCVTDEDSQVGCAIAEIAVSNLAPVIESITAPISPVQVGMFISVSADFYDPGTLDTQTAAWDWGDGSSTEGVAGNQVVTGSHYYGAPGVYTLTLTITDIDGAFDTEVFQYIVVYDPTGGFVTGGGWINSPAGAYTLNPTLTGKATFGFVSKYEKGANVPTGNTEFQFKLANLNFKSTSYDWLVIAGSKAQYKGTGTINGLGEYGFMLTATDGFPDKFRIKIWDKVTGEIIYDNMLGAKDDALPATTIEGGSIVIHK